MVVYAVSSGCNFEGGSIDQLYSSLEKAMIAAYDMLHANEKEAKGRINKFKRASPNHPDFNNRVESYKWKQQELSENSRVKAKWKNYLDYLLVEELEVK